MFDFNVVYKQVNVNMVIRSWQHYNCADAQAGLCRCGSQTGKDRFSPVEAHMNQQIPYCEFIISIHPSIHYRRTTSILRLVVMIIKTFLRKD